MNLIGSFIEIIDQEECLRGFNLYKNASWPSADIKKKATEEEWNSYGFYPINGMVGEVIGIVTNDIYSKPVYVIRILQMFFVPVTSSGIKVISQDEFTIKNSTQINLISNSLSYTSKEKDSLFKVKWQDAKCGLIDNNGILITNYAYEMAAPFKEGRALVKLDGYWGFIDYEGNEVIEPQFETANSFTEGCAIVENYKWYAININGETVSKSYDYMSDFSEGLSAVCLRHNWGFVDVNGNEKIPLIYDAVFNFNNRCAIVKKNRKYGIVSKAGNEIISPSYDFISGISKNNKIAVSINDKWGITNLLGETDLNLEYESLFIYMNDLYCAKKNNKYGYIDDNKNIIIPFIYDDAEVFVNGIAKVVKGDKTGYIDTQNNTVIPFIYDDGESEINNLIAVKKSGKWGCINRAEEIIIPFKLDYRFWFKNNVAEVSLKNETWLVNNEGVFIKKL